MRFRRAPQRYGRTPEPETPYQRAGQLWDERIGSARVQARNWRLMAFGGLFLAGGLSSALVWQSAQSRIMPYVVEVDKLGAARAVVPADTEYEPTDPQIAWHLGQFITHVRSRSLDPVLMREDWLSAYDFVTRRAALFLGEYARASSPFAEIGTRTVSVQVTSIVRASDKSFRVNWTETTYERGARVDRSRWTAVLTVKVETPKSADALRRNPLGLHIDGIDWSREFGLERDAKPPEIPGKARSERRQSLLDRRNIPLGSPLDPTLGQGSRAEQRERTRP
ncbi:conjugal transfer protein TrbF [Sphingopyxis indica]|uniref:conjugal transfer protein TrbF n=1 Tax=Sphingopyxis indica TaxID=436663 RepID=UPI0029391811|nr:conjugal transfer protein TrbF [Sphingopyxis indica]WOF44562.1 conjugal transfer protein TrbF [Sphingopyxis indica]